MNIEEESLARTLAQPQKPNLTLRDVRMGDPLQEHAQDLGLDIPAPKPNPEVEKLRQTVEKLKQWWTPTQPQ